MSWENSQKTLTWTTFVNSIFSSKKLENEKWTLETFFILASSTRNFYLQKIQKSQNERG